MSYDLIKLTQIPNPEINSGLPTALFVNPYMIASISRTVGAHNYVIPPAQKSSWYRRWLPRSAAEKRGR